MKVPGMVRAGYYAVDAKAETAMHGTWKKGPGVELFTALEQVRSRPQPIGCPAMLSTAAESSSLWAGSSAHLPVKRTINQSRPAHCQAR